MWRRLISSQLHSLSSSSRIPAAAATNRSLVGASRAPATSSLIARHFSTGTDGEVSKVKLKVVDVERIATGHEREELQAMLQAKLKVEDVVPIATGHEREELQAALEGRDILEIDHPIGPFGTKEEPAVVKSYYDKRIVGCPGGVGEDEHDVVWFWLKKGKSHECPVCSQYFVLEVVGPGGPPDGHASDEEEEAGHHH